MIFFYLFRSDRSFKDVSKVSTQAPMPWELELRAWTAWYSTKQPRRPLVGPLGVLVFMGPGTFKNFDLDKIKKMCRMEVVYRQEIYAILRSSDTLNLKGSTYLTSNLTLVLCYKTKQKKVSENSSSSPEAAIKYWGCDLSLQWEHKFSTILAFFYISGKMDWHTLCTGFKFKSLFYFFFINNDLTGSNTTESP